MNTQKLILVAAISTIIAACGSTPKEETSLSNIPQWVLNPVVEDGIAASNCVKSSGNFSVDQKMATANGRLALAQQIEVRVEGLDKTYDRRTDANGDTSSGSNFSSVSKQLTKTKLVGSRPIKTDMVMISGKEHFCVLTTLSPNATKDLFKSIVQDSERKVNAQDEKFLYEEFKAHKAEQSLEKEIARLTGE
jgi:hypothetical protein